MATLFSAGTSFWIAADPHLWFILSDPAIDARTVLYVNVTTLNLSALPSDAFNDRACIIAPGEHPFIIATSCVCYSGAHTCSISQLEKRYENGDLHFGQPASQPLLNKMRKSAEKSMHMETDHFQILLDQNLI